MPSDPRPSTPEAPARRGAGRTGPLGVLTAVVAAVVIVVDQLTKSWALHHTAPPQHVVGPLWLELTFNPGAAFGLGKGVTPVVETAVIILVAILLLGARRSARRGDRLEALALGLLVGGALGNLGDRLFRHLPGHPGAVIDWIEVAQVRGHEYWPVFNLADASIVVGAILLAWRLSVRPARHRAAGASAGTADGGQPAEGDQSAAGVGSAGGASPAGAPSDEPRAG